MSEPSRKLSSEEVNALMEGLKSGDLSASTTIKDGKEVEFDAMWSSSLTDSATKGLPDNSSLSFSARISSLTKS